MQYLSYILYYMKTSLFFFLFFSFQYLQAQSGCTDPSAVNYESAALVNNGSCNYSPSYASFTLKGTLASVNSESSGLEYFDGDILSHNDGGNGAELFVLDSATGTIKQTIYIDNYPNTDWEDISADQEYVYIGDVGNNDGSRKNLKILKIKRSDISKSAVVHVNAEAIFFSYADQITFTPNSTTNFDCEAICALGDSIYLFSKNKGDNQTRVYRAPKTPGTYVLTSYTSYNVEGQITGADYNPVTKQIAIIGYELKTYTSFVWLLYDFKGLLFFSGHKRKVVVGKTLSQTEGITFDTTHNRLFISCERAGFTSASLYTLNTITSAVTGSINKVGAPPIAFYPNPSNEYIQVRHTEQITHIQLSDALGHILFEDTPFTLDYRLSLDRFPYCTGIYSLRISGSGYQFQDLVMLTHE